jgi:hypothetical protein
VEQTNAATRIKRKSGNDMSREPFGGGSCDCRH